MSSALIGIVRLVQVFVVVELKVRIGLEFLVGYPVRVIKLGYTTLGLDFGFVSLIEFKLMIAKRYKHCNKCDKKYYLSTGLLCILYILNI